ncbi:MAG: hypothetical protein LUE12_07615 [Ruminococcus sp.]|nr:hypothetical protein [Ruminococcus sp.]
MQKKFFISKNSDSISNASRVCAPELDRFRRIEKLNLMLANGWEIKGFENSENDSTGSYFLLEKRV